MLLVGFDAVHRVFGRSFWFILWPLSTHEMFAIYYNFQVYCICMLLSSLTIICGLYIFNSVPSFNSFFFGDIPFWIKRAHTEVMRTTSLILVCCEELIDMQLHAVSVISIYAWQLHLKKSIARKMHLWAALCADQNFAGQPWVCLFAYSICICSLNQTRCRGRRKGPPLKINKHLFGLSHVYFE